MVGFCEIWERRTERRRQREARRPVIKGYGRVAMPGERVVKTEE